MSSIIHFTDSFDNIKSIIESKSFKLFYCKEDFYLGNKKVSSAVHPMVSFSEQSVTTLHKKNITYGRYGIALKQEWISKKKIHSVLYIDHNSEIASSLAALLKARRKRATQQLAPHVRLSIITIKCFTKNAVGYNSYFNVSNFDFKKEKEWRFVPTKKQINGRLISQTKSKYKDNPDFYNKQLEKFPLRFEIKDIEYIFVETPDQKNQLLKLMLVDKKTIRLSKWTSGLKKQIPIE